MDLVLVRHARPLRHDAAKGRADSARSEEGHAEACRLGRWLAASRRDHRSVVSLNETAHPGDRPW